MMEGVQIKQEKEDDDWANYQMPSGANSSASDDHRLPPTEFCYVHNAFIVPIKQEDPDSLSPYKYTLDIKPVKKWQLEVDPADLEAHGLKLRTTELCETPPLESVTEDSLTYDLAMVTPYEPLFSGNDTREFACSLCLNTFSESKELDQHMLLHNGEKEHECITCSRKFINPRNRDSHQLLCDGKRKSKFIKVKELVSDVQTVTISDLQCKLCYRKYTLLKAYEQHTQPNGQGCPNYCHICQKSQSNLKLHLSRVHSSFHHSVTSAVSASISNMYTGAKSNSAQMKMTAFRIGAKSTSMLDLSKGLFWCRLCVCRIFMSADARNYHEHTCHKNNAYFCYYCDKKFATETELGKHEDTHIRLLKKYRMTRRSIRYCERNCKSIKNTIEHKTNGANSLSSKVMTIKSSSMYSQLSTGNCFVGVHRLKTRGRMSFSSKQLSNLLVKGTKSMSEVKPHLTQSKKNKLFKKGWMSPQKEIHTAEHKLQTKFQCSCCSRYFLSRSLLRSHTLEVHNETTRKDNALVHSASKKEFCCRYCDDGFTSMMLRYTHEQKCKPQKSSASILSSSVSESLNCKYCTKTFRSAYCRKQHEKFYHKIVAESDCIGKSNKRVQRRSLRYN